MVLTLQSVTGEWRLPRDRQLSLSAASLGMGQPPPFLVQPSTDQDAGQQYFEQEERKPGELQM